MKKVCAWCRKEMGEKPPFEDESITYSICEECLEEYLKPESIKSRPQKS